MEKWDNGTYWNKYKTYFYMALFTLFIHVNKWCLCRETKCVSKLNTFGERMYVDRSQSFRMDDQKCKVDHSYFNIALLVQVKQ